MTCIVISVSYSISKSETISVYRISEKNQYQPSHHKNLHFTFPIIIIEALISKQYFQGEACWQSSNNRNVLKSNHVL